MIVTIIFFVVGIGFIIIQFLPQKQKETSKEESKQKHQEQQMETDMSSLEEEKIEKETVNENDSYEVKVYFSDNQEIYQDLFPVEAYTYLLKSIQLQLEQAGYRDMAELEVIPKSCLKREDYQGFEFKIQAYPQVKFAVEYKKDTKEFILSEILSNDG